MIKIRLIIAALTVTFAVTAAQAQVKIGTVDMNSVFTSYSKTKEAESKLNEVRVTAKKQIDDKLATLKATLDEITALNADAEKPELSSEAKKKIEKKSEDKTQEARNLDRSIAEFRTAQERQLQEQYMRMRKDIVEDIMKIIDKKVSNAGYDIVFDKSGLSMGQIPLVIFARPEIDFSAEISNILASKSDSGTKPQK